MAGGRKEKQTGYTIVLDNGLTASIPLRGTFPEEEKSAAGQGLNEDIPERIAAMRAMYRYGDGSVRDKAENFIRQGKFMADYSDDMPWQGNLYRYFPAYHDLNVPQLRAYFSWRAGVREGKFTPVPQTLYTLYANELLVGIGCRDAEDSFRKMKAFYEGLQGAGQTGGEVLARLRRWMTDLCIVYDLPHEWPRDVEDSFYRDMDTARICLEKPEEHTDEEIIAALSAFAPARFPQSPVFSVERGRHLFALIWKTLSSSYTVKGRTIFTTCFNARRQRFSWTPFPEALYIPPAEQADRSYELHPGRRYQCRDGHWTVERYNFYSVNQTVFRTILHESERRLREILGVGRPLKADVLESWVDRYIDEALVREQEEIRQARLSAIHFEAGDLAAIRADAAVTRDSLLTEEEREAEAEVEERAELEAGRRGNGGTPSMKNRTEVQASARGLDLMGPAEAELSDDGLFDKESPDDEPALGAHEMAILRLLLDGKSPADYIREKRLFATVLADSINEALYDALGDTAVECDGKDIILVEDYREDIEELIGAEV